MNSVLVSGTFQRQFRALPASVKRRVRAALKQLEDDPVTKRPKVDIKALRDTSPPKHRLRVGDYRIIYRVDGKVVRVIEVFRRGRGYREG